MPTRSTACCRCCAPARRSPGFTSRARATSTFTGSTTASCAGFRARGGEIRTAAEVLALDRDGDGWRIETRGGTLRAGIVVNAAGAWADQVAALAGVAQFGLEPRRRTALTVAAPAGCDPSPWPMAVDVEESFYIKPDAGRLLMSPADETPSAPCDAQPDEMDVAICIDRVERAFDLTVRRIEAKWAGLRSFVADRVPVVGYAPDAPGFLLAGGPGRLRHPVVAGAGAAGGGAGRGPAGADRHRRRGGVGGRSCPGPADPRGVSRPRGQKPAGFTRAPGPRPRITRPDGAPGS